jgi:hypothetical protein
MQNRPTANELMKGVYRFLENEVIPVLQEPLRFHTRVAANLLKIIEREWKLERNQLMAEASRLTTLLGAGTPTSHTLEDFRTAVMQFNEILCREIRSGRADQGPWRKQVMGHVRKTLTETLEITNPKSASRNCSGSEASDRPYPKTKRD